MDVGGGVGGISVDVRREEGHKSQTDGHGEWVRVCKGGFHPRVRSTP